MVEALGQTMLAQALGSTFTKAQQLPALQASYRTAMEELARQTAANDALKAELADQKAMMERAARGAGASGLGAVAAHVAGTAEEAAAAEAAAAAAARRAAELAAELRASAAAAEGVRAQLGGVERQRQKLIQSAADIALLIKRLQSADQADAEELAEQRQAAAEAALIAAAKDHAAAVAEEAERTKAAEARAEEAEAALMQLQLKNVQLQQMAEERDEGAAAAAAGRPPPARRRRRRRRRRRAARRRRRRRM